MAEIVAPASFKLRQALAYDRGELEGQVDVCSAPPAVDVRKVREKIELSPRGSSCV